MRVQTSNQIHGLLMEYGVVVNKGCERFKKDVLAALENADNHLTPAIRDLLKTMLNLFSELRDRQSAIERKIQALMAENEDYKRLLAIPGIGPNGASMFIASVGDPNVFKNGRHLAAWVGLVPIQYSSGGKDQLGSITKSGDQQLRAVLIHGARSLLLSTIRKQKTDSRSQWILRLYKEKGWNKAAVAIANRNVRIMWHLFKYKEEYKAS
jgi:transposase